MRVLGSLGAGVAVTSCHTRIMQKGCDTADPVDAGRGKLDRRMPDAGADSASMMPSLDQIDRFLTERFGPVADLVTLQAGANVIETVDAVRAMLPQLQSLMRNLEAIVEPPVFDPAGRAILFWVASRGHHADVGGISPGSMSPMISTPASFISETPSASRAC